MKKKSSTRVNTSSDCGNSPKNLFVENLSIALALNDDDLVHNSVTDNIRWLRVGDTVIEGKERLAQTLADRNPNPPDEITIHHVATHGKVGAVNGVLRFQNGNTFAFCDVFEFNNVKGTSVCEITTYRIEIE